MSEHALSVTLKAGTGFDSPWVVVYGDTPADVESKLSDIDGVLKAAVTAGATLRSLHTLETGGVPATPIAQESAPQAAPAQQAGGWSTSAPAAAPAWSGAQQQPAATGHPEAKGCESCGQVLQFKSGTSKAGKPYKLWACPAQRQRGDGHTTEFVNN